MFLVDVGLEFTQGEDAVDLGEITEAETLTRRIFNNSIIDTSKNSYTNMTTEYAIPKVDHDLDPTRGGQDQGPEVGGPANPDHEVDLPTDLTDGDLVLHPTMKEHHPLENVPANTVDRVGPVQRKKKDLDLQAIDR